MAPTREDGKMESNMARESTNGTLEVNMKVIGRMVNLMVLGHTHGQVVPHTQANGKKGKKTGTAASFGPTVPHMRASLWMIRNMESVNIYLGVADGTKYYGEYENDKMHGQGTYLFPDGARFVGEFRNNNFEGFGTYTTPDGTCYVGEFKNDQRHGVGLLKPPHLGVFKVRYVA
jgi:hypothetical protein